MTDLGLLENAASLVGIPQQSERTDLGQKKSRSESAGAFRAVIFFLRMLRFNPNMI